MLQSLFLFQARSGIAEGLRTKRRLSGSLLLLLTAGASVLPAQAAPEPPPAWRLVKERCVLCHYIDRPEAKFAPSLQGLFKRQKLMNGKPVNDQTVSEWISEGSANMPAFQHTLTPAQIQTIIDFLKSK